MWRFHKIILLNKLAAHKIKTKIHKYFITLFFVFVYRFVPEHLAICHMIIIRFFVFLNFLCHRVSVCELCRLWLMKLKTVEQKDNHTNQKKLINMLLKFDSNNDEFIFRKEV